MVSCLSTEAPRSAAGSIAATGRRFRMRADRAQRGAARARVDDTEERARCSRVDAYVYACRFEESSSSTAVSAKRAIHSDL
mmetsp:Transcript_23057/g.72239  ORF Transcript_23057/g.72239 Transcript_23057/m.72239 type:complete len:81 (+) Transcript_23057:892-1134(+)